MGVCMWWDGFIFVSETSKTSIFMTRLSFVLIQSVYVCTETVLKNWHEKALADHFCKESLFINLSCQLYICDGDVA